MGSWRLVPTALGNGSCTFKWDRLNFLPLWRAEAVGTGVWRGCAPLKAPREGVASILRVSRPASSNLLPPSHKDSVITRLSRWAPHNLPAQGPQLNPAGTIPLPRKVTRSQVLGIRTQTPWEPSPRGGGGARPEAAFSSVMGQFVRLTAWGKGDALHLSAETPYPAQRPHRSL